MSALPIGRQTRAPHNYTWLRRHADLARRRRQQVFPAIPAGPPPHLPRKSIPGREEYSRPAARCFPLEKPTAKPGDLIFPDTFRLTGKNRISKDGSLPRPAMSLIPSESYSFPDHFTTTVTPLRQPKAEKIEARLEKPRAKPNT